MPAATVQPVSHDRAVVAWRKISDGRRDRREQLTAFVVRDQQNATFTVLVEEALSDAAESVEVTVAQRVRQRQHLQRTGHALDFGIKHEADIAYRFDNALRGVLAVLLLDGGHDNGRKNDQRQRGSRNQKS